MGRLSHGRPTRGGHLPAVLASGVGAVKSFPGGKPALPTSGMVTDYQRQIGV